MPNDESGIAHVIERLRALPIVLIVLEATGGLELPLIGALGRPRTCSGLTGERAR